MDISYNGIAFGLVKTNELSFTPVWSDDGTTYLYTRVYLDVEGIINPETMAYTSAGGTPVLTPGVIPPSTVVAVRHALTQPRAPLVISSPTGVPGFPSVTVIRSPAPGHSVDLNNGPRPGVCSVTNLQGARTWYVHWTCETWIHECPGEDSVTTPILSNRYTQEDAIDEQWLSTRTTSGVTKFRTDILEDTGRTADDFRAFVIPPTPLGFQRKRISVTAVSSRNELHWSVTDAERMYDLGDTASTGSYITDIQGTFGISSLVTAGVGIPSGQTLSHLNIRVVGDKRASNWVLTQRAFALAAAKIPLASATAGYIQQISINQSLVDRDVTLNIVYMNIAANNGPLWGMAVDSLKVDSIFPDQGGVNPSPPWGKGTQGTSRLKLLVSALEAACAGAAPPEPNEMGAVDGPGAQDGPQPVIQINGFDVLPREPTKYAPPSSRPYNEYHMETEYRRAAGVLMCPVAAPLGSEAPLTAFFRTSRPMTTVRVAWRTERIGATPQVPAPESNNENFVLLDHRITPVAPQVLPDGNTYVYRVEGEYLYGAKVAMGTTEALPLGAVPWISTQFEDLAIQPTDYYHGISDSSGTAG